MLNAEQLERKAKAHARFKEITCLQNPPGSGIDFEQYPEDDPIEERRGKYVEPRVQVAWECWVGMQTMGTVRSLW